ncbi:MAG: ABC transporter ATP-binding protein [Thermoguttaceae bacterium]|nr:ABC transporter ATP-binding protein [Thermoguttaceae bacterium]
MSSPSPIIEITSCDFAYQPSDPVLEDVNLTVDEGEFASIIGPNGGGKTTLVRLILGLLTPRRGNVSLFGGDPARTRLAAGYVPQQIHSDRLFPISVQEVVLTGRLGHKAPKNAPWGERVRRALFRYTDADAEAARGALARMGLSGLEQKAFGDLSGGERQRTLIARAIASSPRLLILDEPTNNMDPQGTELLYSLLEEENRRMTILIVSHDLGVVSRYVRSAICVNRHVLVHPTSQLDGTAIRELYGSDQLLVRHDHRCHEAGHQHLPE